MKIAVCVKIVPKTEDVKLDPVTKNLKREGAESVINEADRNALEAALKLKDANGGEVIVISMGPPMFEQQLKLPIAMGADNAILLSDRAFGGADTHPTSLTLASAVRKIGDCDVVLCGEESSDSGTGHVPGGIAEWLDMPQVTFASDVRIVDGKAVCKRTIEGGTETVEATLPAVISVELGTNTARFPDFRRKRWADTQFKVTVWGKDDLGLKDDEIGKKGSFTSVKELREAMAPERKHSLIEGTLEEKAKKIVEIVKPFLEGK